MAVKTSVNSASFAIAKKSRVPLTEIDVRGAEATRQLGRIIPASTGRSLRASTFNSAL
jgi:FXSXX-COOH protein